MSYNNKILAKNTLALYFRMGIGMLVSLYTSRIILSTLGFSDYGIYNVVGGIIVMFGIFSSGMTSATQRFFSFSLGQNDSEGLKKVFGTTVRIQVILGTIIVCLAEICGIWMLENKLVIPLDRMIAAHWVMQCTFLCFFITVCTIPFISAIVSHENMGIYAYISIFEVVAKLFIVYLLQIATMDKLILYAILYLLVTIVVSLVFTFYCWKNYQESHYLLAFDKKRFQEMFSFASWSIFGNIGTFKDQGVNFIINIFFGTTMNAARGIANQVNALVGCFSTNFMTALIPQITKTYAAGQIEESKNLVYAGTKFSFFLISIIILPISLNVDFVLKLWLGNVPPYTREFVFLILMAALLNAMTHAVYHAIQATGKVKAFQILNCCLFISEIPFAYLLLKLGLPPYTAVLPMLFTNTALLFCRFLLLRSYIPQYSLFFYTFSIIGRNLFSFIISFTVVFIIKNVVPINFLTFIIISVLADIVLSLSFFTFALNSEERAKVKGILHRIHAIGSSTNKEHTI